jgi:hypothetical protein
MSDRDDVIAYVRTIDVPQHMTNCQELVDYLVARINEDPRPESDGLQQVAEALTFHTAAMLEIINSLAGIERWIAERNS